MNNTIGSRYPAWELVWSNDPHFPSSPHPASIDFSPVAANCRRRPPRFEVQNEPIPPETSTPRDAPRLTRTRTAGRCFASLCSKPVQRSPSRVAWLRFPHTIDINDHVENILLVEHDLQTQEFVVPWGACAPPDRAAADLLPYAPRTATTHAPSGLGLPVPISTARSS